MELSRFSELSLTALHDLRNTLSHKYEQYQSAKLNLDLTRGKPASDQLDLSNELDGILGGFYLLQDGTDVRNYGGILGIPEARELGKERDPDDHLRHGVFVRRFGGGPSCDTTLAWPEGHPDILLPGFFVRTRRAGARPGRRVGTRGSINRGASALRGRDNR